MKVAQRIGRALAWFNLVYWGFSVFTGLLQALAMGNMGVLVFIVLMAAIPLNSYAALQLHRSIRNPEVKLNHQTPVGIRFMGTFVILIGIAFTGLGLIVVGGAREFLPMWKQQAAEMKQLEGITSAAQLQGLGAMLAFFGILMIASAIINMRLLRWYYLVNKSDVS